MADSGSFLLSPRHDNKQAHPFHLSLGGGQRRGEGVDLGVPFPDLVHDSREFAILSTWHVLTCCQMNIESDELLLCLTDKISWKDTFPSTGEKYSPIVSSQGAQCGTTATIKFPPFSFEPWAAALLSQHAQHNVHMEKISFLLADTNYEVKSWPYIFKIRLFTKLISVSPPLVRPIMLCTEIG